MKNTYRNAFFLVALLVMVFTVSSCYRKKDTIASVTVVDANNNPLGGQEVRLTYDTTGSFDEDVVRIDQTATTDASGVASFNFNDLYKSGQAGFAVLDIYVNGAVVGIIKIEEEVTSEETVVI